MAGRKLESRERIALGVAGALIAAAVVYWLAQGPLDKYHQAEARLRAARANLAAAEELHKKAAAARLEGQALDSLLAVRSPNYDLGTEVYRAIQAQGLTDRSQTETERGIRGAYAERIELEGVSMEELIGLLYEIHRGDDLIVLQKLDYLRPMPDGKGLECRFVLITPRGA